MPDGGFLAEELKLPAVSGVGESVGAGAGACAALPATARLTSSASPVCLRILNSALYACQLGETVRRFAATEGAGRSDRRSFRDPSTRSM